MEKKMLRWTTYAIFAFVLFLVVAFVLVGPDLTKMDYGNIFSRSGWQLPDRVLASLDIQPGARVADIGSGDGYFTFLLANAVGPSRCGPSLRTPDVLMWNRSAVATPRERPSFVEVEKR